ncbi:MAG: hypothetical protein KJN99_12460, partial [Marinicaulis sp.]|nr:hypothetical protein [Marinicaulis sp.]
MKNQLSNASSEPQNLRRSRREDQTKFAANSGGARDATESKIATTVAGNVALKRKPLKRNFFDQV